MPASRYGDAALFLAVSIAFGTAFPAIEVGLTALPPLSFAAARYSLSAVLLLGYASVSAHVRAAGSAARWLPATRRDLTAVAVGGTLLVGATGLTFVGQQFTTGGVAAILVSLSPLVTALLAWPLLPEERLSRRGVAGVFVGLLGVGLVLSPDPAALLDPTLVGKASILVATVSVSLATVLVRRTRPSLPTVPFTGWAMALGAALQAGAAALVGESVPAAALTPAAVGAVAYLGAVAGAGGFVGYFTLLRRVGALEANLVTYVNPVVAVVVGALLLDERVAATAAAGFLLVATGFLLVKNREIAAELARFRGAAR